MEKFSQFHISAHPHRRYSALTGEWILVSPHRTERPWQGRQEKVISQRIPPYDSNCYLCPGNERAAGEKNPKYSSTFVFTNDFSALLPETPGIQEKANYLLTLPEMDEENIKEVVDVWASQVTELGKQYRWVQLFENRGEIMGCSNHHPHGQVWASKSLPNEPAKENLQQKKYSDRNKSNLLLDYLQEENERGERLLIENNQWQVLVPFWAIWPFETLLLPKRHILRLPDLQERERAALAGILKRLLTRYDNLFNISFPYTMGWHGAPIDDENYNHWQLHAHFYPPLLRSASIKKFMVGYEMLSEAQRDFTPEQAAEKLRGLSEVHFKTRLK
jgi:UDPglucose--hexose-1-phosphate uridylyltransferase